MDTQRLNRYSIILTCAFTTLLISVISTFYLVHTTRSDCPAVQSEPCSCVTYYCENYDDETLQLINEQRLKDGLSELTINEKLNIAAYRKAQDMIKYNYWAHENPEDGTIRTWEYARDEGYDYIYIGENLGKDYSDPFDLVSAWLNSTKHKGIMLSSNYHEIGIYVDCSGEYQSAKTPLVVTIYGLRIEDTTPTNSR